MPLTAEQNTALDALAGVGVDPQELADAFHEKHGKAAQLIHDTGDAAATRRAGTALRTAERELVAEREAKEKAEAKLKEADPAKVHEQYQAEIKDLTERHKAEVHDLKVKSTERELGRDLAFLEAKLAPRLKPMALKAVLNDPVTAKHFQYGEDGTRTILQRGKDIPYAPSKDKDPLELYAADLVDYVKSIDADSVLVNGTPGGGSGGGGGSSTPADPVAAYSNKRFAPPVIPGRAP